MRIYRAIPLLALLFAAAVLNGCGKKLDSRPLDRQIKIDGRDDEWRDARIYLDNLQASFGLLNDGDYLYLSLGLTDPVRQRQVLATGFTVWFDAEGKKGKTFGVRFPLGMREALESTQPMGAGGVPGQRGGKGMRGMRGRAGGPTADNDPSQMQRLFDKTMQRPELEIIGPHPHQTRRLGLDETGAVQLGVGYHRGRLVYEARIPFIEIYARAGDGPTLDKPLGLGLETPAFNPAALRGRGGGMRGPMGGGRGMGRGGARGMSSRPEPLSYWAKVQLAQPQKE